MDANLSIPMLLLMAQQRDCIVYKDGSKRHLKLVGMLFDNVSTHISNGWLEVTMPLCSVSRYVGPVWRVSLHPFEC